MNDTIKVEKTIYNKVPIPITDYNKVIDVYGNKVFKTGIGQYMNARYEIWEDGALRLHSSDSEFITRRWIHIKENEPPIVEKERCPYIVM